MKEGDLQVALNSSKKVTQVPPDGAAATSSPPSILMGDQPHTSTKSNSNKTHMPKPNNNNDNAKDQPIRTLNKSASSSPPSTLRDTISQLKKIFKIPPEMDSMLNP